MADGFTVKTNLPEFKAQLREFGFDMEQKIIRSGVAAAARVFTKRVIELAPVRKTQQRGRIPGLLKRAIYTKRSRDSKNGFEHYFVGVRQGKAAQKRKGGSLDAFYWRWVEAGHRIVPRGGKLGGGRNTKALKRQRFDAAGGKRTTPVRFLARAFQQAQGPALQALTDRIQKRIDKENAKK